MSNISRTYFLFFLHISTADISNDLYINFSGTSTLTYRELTVNKNKLFGFNYLFRGDSVILEDEGLGETIRREFNTEARKESKDLSYLNL